MAPTELHLRRANCTARIRIHIPEGGTPCLVIGTYDDMMNFDVEDQTDGNPVEGLEVDQNLLMLTLPEDLQAIELIVRYASSNNGGTTREIESIHFIRD